MPELILITGLQHWPKFSRSRLCRCWAWWALVGQDELLNFWQLGMSCGSNDAIFTSHDWEWQVYSTYIWWWLGDGANECKWHCFTHISCDSETLFSQFPNALLLETSSECGSFNLPNHPYRNPLDQGTQTTSSYTSGGPVPKTAEISRCSGGQNGELTPDGIKDMFQVHGPDMPRHSNKK